MKKLTTVLLLLIVQTTTIYAQDNPLLKLSPFTGQWNYTETVSNSGQQNEPTVKTGTATIYFTPDSTALVVDEINEEGHRFRGIHTYDAEQQRYKNFSNRTDGGINWSHYRWDEKKNRGIWYEAELIDPNHPDEKVQLNSEELYAEWLAVNENKHIFRVTITQPDGRKYMRTVEYSNPAWEPEKEKIMDLRKASNQAFMEHDYQKVLSYLTDDVMITSGSGTLISGKEELLETIKNIVNNSPNKNMYWVRTPDEIIVNSSAKLAWENGSWKGFTSESGNNPVVGGNYSAMWTKESGMWKIKSELFVTLEEE